MTEKFLKEPLTVTDLSSDHKINSQSAEKICYNIMYKNN